MNYSPRDMALLTCRYGPIRNPLAELFGSHSLGALDVPPIIRALRPIWPEKPLARAEGASFVMTDSSRKVAKGRPICRSSLVSDLLPALCPFGHRPRRGASACIRGSARWSGWKRARARIGSDPTRRRPSGRASHKCASGRAARASQFLHARRPRGRPPKGPSESFRCPRLYQPC